MYWIGPSCVTSEFGPFTAKFLTTADKTVRPTRLAVSNVFITDLFTPNSTLGNQLLGASRTAPPLPTHTDEFPSSHMIAQRTRLRK